ncbi:type I restriction endonuclease [Paraburkholderia bannensis]|uniref:type I restriction endonuclease n=1 Tax=Paraburkholderia bannensis TaxID=765414 RepID=UPI002AB023EA|nr:type I restriction endonuclease [Paraburkholderia bannensis]
MERLDGSIYTAAHTLCNLNAFARDEGTPLCCALVNINDWSKNTFAAVRQRRINPDCSDRHDVLLLTRGAPAAQIELETLSTICAAQSRRSLNAKTKRLWLQAVLYLVPMPIASYHDPELFTD